MQHLPDNVEELQQIIHQLTTNHKNQLNTLKTHLHQKHNKQIDQQNKALKYFEELQLLRRRLFGRSAKRLSEEDRRQLWLFNKAKLILNNTPQPPQKHIPIQTHTQLKHPHQTLPTKLPKIKTLHNIPPKKKTYNYKHNLIHIKKKPYKKLKIIPPQIQIHHHIQPKYTYKTYKNSNNKDKPTVHITPTITQLLPKSIASPALVAYMLVAKFYDTLPFYQQKQTFKHLKIQINHQNITN